MDIDSIIENMAKEVKSSAKGGGGCVDQHGGGMSEGAEMDFQDFSTRQLCELEILDDSAKVEIYRRFRDDAENYIDSFVHSPRCKDPNADKGMYKCSHETYQACITQFGMEYFRIPKLLHDVKRERTEGGKRLRGELLEIGLDVYEFLCEEYRKVFQVYDCSVFLGITKDYMYKLSEIHGEMLKKAHGASEQSLRIGALTGRGNVTGHAIVLNHDYNYTRTSEVIHTSLSDSKKAVALPVLDDAPQHIVVDSSAVVGAIPDSGL